MVRVPVIGAARAAVMAQNQLFSRAMSGPRARQPQGSTDEPMTPVAAALFAILIVGAVGCLAAVLIFSARSAQPIILAMLAFLAMLGTFFVVGLMAGQVRLGEKPGGLELAKVAADSLENGVLITGQDGKPLFYNREFCEIIGVDENGEPRPLEVAMTGEPQAAECLFRLMRAAELGEFRSEEFRYRGTEARGRAARWLRLAVRPVVTVPGIDTQGQVLWQLTDISRDRAREAEAVRGLESSLAYYESMPIGLLAASPDGSITHLNDALAGWLGLNAEAVRNRTLKLDEIIVGAGGALLRSMLQRAHGASVRLELDLVREDGVGLPVEIVATRVTQGPEAGEITALVLSTITARPRDEAGGAEARYTRLFHSAPFGIATLAEDGKLLTANAAFARMFPEPNQIAAGNIGSLIDTTGDAEARRAIEAALKEARGGRASLAPIEITFGANREFTRRLYLSPIASAVRQGEAATLYVIDATEQKALELKYAQSTKMEAVGKLAGGIAHDFNNVLTAIIGFSDLLLQTHRPTDAAYADIMNIKKEANRAARLVKQLLAFSRRQTLMPETLELGEVLTDLSVLLTRLLGERVDLKIVTGRDLWFVKADRTQFDQVLMNLTVNAKDAMPNGGRLTVRARNISERESLRLRQQSEAVVAGEYVCVEVEDTGTGMTPEIMAKIFEPFFSTKDVGKGTGLGLATVYGIVKQTGGYVFPESTLNKGTIFRVYLPRHIPESVDEVASAREPKKERPRDLTGTGRVLLVEDEDSVRNFAARALKRQGYEVLEATTGAEALELVAKDKGPIDIVVSDVVMPEMDGPTMLTELRKKTPDLKVIFVSGYPDDRFKTGLDPNAQFAFLPKPFTLPQLAAKVKEELGR